MSIDNSTVVAICFDGKHCDGNSHTLCYNNHNITCVTFKLLNRIEWISLSVLAKQKLNIKLLVENNVFHFYASSAFLSQVVQ